MMPDDLSGRHVMTVRMKDARTGDLVAVLEDGERKWVRVLGLFRGNGPASRLWVTDGNVAQAFHTRSARTKIRIARRVTARAAAGGSIT